MSNVNHTCLGVQLLCWLLLFGVTQVTHFLYPQLLFKQERRLSPEVPWQYFNQGQSLGNLNFTGMISEIGDYNV